MVENDGGAESASRIAKARARTRNGNGAIEGTMRKNRPAPGFRSSLETRGDAGPGAGPRPGRRERVRLVYPAHRRNNWWHQSAREIPQGSRVGESPVTAFPSRAERPSTRSAQSARP